MNINEKEILTYRGGQIKYVKNFLLIDEANIMLKKLLNNILWEEGSIKIFGKEVIIPRKQCWIADQGIHYSYSRKILKRYEWNDELLILKAKVERITNYKFNSVLANLYRDGEDSMGWHADNEIELGEKPLIASLSLGSNRNLNIRDNITKKIIKISQDHGSLTIMEPELQKNAQHSISKTKLDVSPRINLTFRNIIQTI